MFNMRLIEDYSEYKYHKLISADAHAGISAYKLNGDIPGQICERQCYLSLIHQPSNGLCWC